MSKLGRLFIVTLAIMIISTAAIGMVYASVHLIHPDMLIPRYIGPSIEDLRKWHGSDRFENPALTRGDVSDYSEISQVLETWMKYARDYEQEISVVDKQVSQIKKVLNLYGDWTGYHDYANDSISMVILTDESRSHDDLSVLQAMMKETHDIGGEYRRTLFFNQTDDTKLRPIFNKYKLAVDELDVKVSQFILNHQ